MPLKHATETFLVFLLGVIIALTGLLLATVPDLPAGTVPCGIFLALTIAYPLSLTRLMRVNRADHAFRWLHWFPAFMVVVWFAAGLIALFLPLYAPWTQGVTWGGTLLLVTLGIVFLLWYSLHVIRRRGSRVALLFAILLPYAALAVTSERMEWQGDRQLASVLWSGSWWQVAGERITGSGARTSLAGKLPSEKTLEHSEDVTEERWRNRLRVFERRRLRIAARADEEGQRSADTIIASGAQISAAKTGPEIAIGSASSLPSSLPKSGPDLAAILALTMAGLYGAVLHHRARNREMEN